MSVSATPQAAASDSHDLEAPWRKLGVPADADETTIKKAYRRLVLKCAHNSCPRAYLGLGGGLLSCHSSGRKRRPLLQVTLLISEPSKPAAATKGSVQWSASPRSTALHQQDQRVPRFTLPRVLAQRRRSVAA